MFSVVIPLYNKEKSIRNTLQSVLDQTFRDFEIIIVNDGSTDNSLEVVQSFNDIRIRIINQKNGGVSSARNRGIKEAKYEWIAFLDADDLWKTNHLLTITELIYKYPEDIAFCTSFLRSDEINPNTYDDSIKIVDNYFKEALKKHFFWTSVVVIHRNIFKQIGLFDTKLSRGEDLDLWIRLGRKYRIIRSCRTTAIYSQDSENKACNTVPSIDKYFLPSKLKGMAKYERKYMEKLVTSVFIEMLYNKKYKNLMFMISKYRFYSIILLGKSFLLIGKRKLYRIKTK